MVGLTEDRHRDRMYNWAIKALLDIGIQYYSLKSTGWMPINDMVFDKPKDLFAIEKIEIRGSCGCVEPRHVSVIDNCPCCNCNSSCDVEYSEMDNCFQIGNTKDIWSEAKLIYYNVPTDSEGNLQVPAEAEMAIETFIILRYKQRERNSRKQSSVTVADINSLKQEYGQDRNAAISSMRSKGLANTKTLDEIGLIRMNLGSSPLDSCARNFYNKTNNGKISL